MLPEAPRYDLHMHTRASDGSKTIQELAVEAGEKGIAGIGICDHDTLMTVHAVRELQGDSTEPARVEGVTVFGGVEISAFDPETGKKVHIAAFGFPADTKDDTSRVHALTERIRVMRRDNALEQRDLLKAAGYRFDEDVFDVACEGGATLYKQYLMEAMTDAAYGTPEYKTLYAETFGSSGKFYRSVPYPPALDALEAVVADGGFPILVHPGEAGVFHQVEPLVEAGLRGIEVHHPNHGEDDVLLALEFAQEFDLLPTGGSDYHGAYGKTVMGQCLAPTGYAERYDSQLAQ